MKLGIRRKLNDQDFRNIKEAEISYRNGSLITPTRSLQLKPDKYCESRLISSKEARGINEIYLTINRESVAKLNDSENMLQYCRSINNLLNKSKEGELNLLFFKLSYREKHNSFDQKNLTDFEIEFLNKISNHPLVDVLIPPCIPTLSAKTYIQFIKQFIEITKSYKKNISIAGYFPLYDQNDFKELCRIYFEEQLQFFILDLNGKSPVDAYYFVNSLMDFKTLIEEQYKLDSFSYALNVPLTKPIRKTEVGSSKEMNTFLMGFDSFGTSHISPKRPKDFYEKIKQQSKSVSDEEQVFHLFNENDYGYYRSNMTTISKLFPLKDKNSINIQNLFNKEISLDNLKKVRKAFNVERQAKESLRIQENIEEKTLRSYVQSKKYLDNTYTKYFK